MGLSTYSGTHDPEDIALTRLDEAAYMSVKPAIRVVLADDSTLVREHLVAMLGDLEGVAVVGEAVNVDDAIAAVRRLRPEVVVLDIHMPGGNGIVALKHIKKEFPDIQVIMLTNHANDFYRQTCMRAGASFFFDKSAEFEQVSDVLRSMAGAL